MGRLRQTSYRKRRIYEFDERSRSQYLARCCRCWCIGWFRCCQEGVHQHENFCLKIYSLKTYIFRVCRQYCSELVLCINIITSNPLITHTHSTHQIYLLFLPTEDLFYFAGPFFFLFLLLLLLSGLLFESEFIS